MFTIIGAVDGLSIVTYNVAEALFCARSILNLTLIS